MAINIMIVSQHTNQPNIYHNKTLTFSSHSSELKRVDDVYRRVANEFPIVYSGTRFAKFRDYFTDS